MNKKVALPHERLICGAKNRQGNPCKRSPSPDRNRCNLHGGKSPRGKDHPGFKHGYYTIKAKEQRRELRILIKALHGMAESFKLPSPRVPGNPRNHQITEYTSDL